MNIVPIESTNDGLVVTSETIAEGAGVQHKNVLDLVKTHQLHLIEFGQVAFETRPGYNNASVRVAMLNEQQATLLLTFMRNTDQVIDFKVALVKAFYDMAQRLTSPLAHPDLVSRKELALMIVAAEEEKAELEAKIIEDAPKIDYHQRFVAEQDDLITVDNFASQYGSTGPKVRELLTGKNVAVKKHICARWSQSKQQMVDEFEWRPRQGVPSSAWFDLRPQHNAPRLHNGQVRQTMYVRQYHAEALARKLGLIVDQHAA